MGWFSVSQPSGSVEREYSISYSASSPYYHQHAALQWPMGQRQRPTASFETGHPLCLLGHAAHRVCGRGAHANWREINYQAIEKPDEATRPVNFRRPVHVSSGRGELATIGCQPAPR